MSYYSKGGFTYKDICDMEFDLYELVLKETERVKTDKHEDSEIEEDNG